MQKLRQRREYAGFELLETRSLLSVDLQIQHDTFEPSGPGEEVTRVIRVFNHSNQLAEAVLVRSSLTEELTSPTWIREVGPAKRLPNPTTFKSADFRLFEPVARSPWENTYTDGVLEVGDIDGDGNDDFLFYQRFSGRDHRVNASVIFGPLIQDVAGHVGRLSQDVGMRGIDIITPDTPGGAWFEFQTLGDINNDGFDDIAFANTVLFGRSGLTGAGNVDLTRLDTGEGFTILNGYQVYGIGDPNLDGIRDIAVSSLADQSVSYLLWGNEELESQVNLEPASYVAGGTTARGMPIAGFISDASAVGDLNSDGSDDFAVASSGVTVVFANDQIASDILVGDITDRSTGFRIRDSFGFTAFSFQGLNEQGMTVEAAGDFDNDGFDDLLLSFDGGDCSCTASDRANRDRHGGAVVVFGGTDVAANGEFDVSSDRFVKYEISTRYNGDRRPFANSGDFNHDGVSDIKLTTGAFSQFILGGHEVKDIDFGFGGYWGPDFDYSWYEGFNGENGYGQAGDLNVFDVNSDGILDELVQDPAKEYFVFLGQPDEQPPISGAGSIEDLIDIAPGTSVIYTVQGTRKEQASEISSSVIGPLGQIEADLRDNAASSRSAIELQVEVSEFRRVTRGGEVHFEVGVHNSGPFDARDVRITDTISASLQDISWTRAEEPFPSILMVSEFQGPDGAQFSGPKRIWTEYERAPGYDIPLFIGLGSTVGSLGDTNEDGFDEVYGVGSDGTAILFQGGPGVGIHGLLPPATAEITPNFKLPEVKPGIADVNGDGFADRITSNWQASDFRGATFVTFGTETGIPEVAIDELNGRNGFVIRGTERGDGSGHAITTGDVNADGFDDVIVAQGCSTMCLIDDGSELLVFPGLVRPNVHVVFGGPSVGEHGVLELSDIDGGNGFRIELQKRRFSWLEHRATVVASDFDVNGDGIDDIVIGDAGAGEASCFLCTHGAMYVVFGRRQASHSGVGPIDDLIEIPQKGRVRYTIKASVPQVGDEIIMGRVMAIASSAQLELDPRSNEAHISFAREPLLGDLNEDRRVDLLDFQVLAANFGRHSAAYSDGDVDENTVVDFLDFVIFVNQLGKTSAA